MEFSIESGLSRAPRRSVPDEIAAGLANAIVLGRLAPGERLREHDLAVRMEVSRGTLREALVVLERQHLVVSSPGKGARVAPLDLDWVRDIHEVWYALFSVLLARIARDVDDADLAQLAEAVDELTVGPETPSAFLEETRQMVELCCRVHGDSLLTRQLRSLLPASLRCFRHALANDPAEITATREFAGRVLELARQHRARPVREAASRFAEEQFERLRSLLEQGLR